jgi:hypothetical protein
MQKYRLNYKLNGEYLTLLFSADSKTLAKDHAQHHCYVIGATLLSVVKA